MKSLKKVIKILVAVLLIIFCLSFAAGCWKIWTCGISSPQKYEIRTVGDFEVCFYVDHCEIIGTTEQGKSKKYLIIPEYIDGVLVESLGLYSGFFGLTVAHIDSNVLEKVYFEAAVAVNEHSFVACKNIKKIMYPKVNDYSRRLRGIGASTLYLPHKEFEENGFNGYNIDSANISYYYNYENAKSDYYWIDDEDYGSTIEFIPPDPEREGYVFGGWYKEAECINKWDFDSDTLPEEKTEISEDGEEEVVYQETKLYAKWM